MPRVPLLVVSPGLAAIAVGAALVAVVGAQQPAGPPSPAEQARRQEKASAQSAEAQAGLIAYLNPIGFAQARSRAETVAALTTKDAALARQADVRRRIEA